MAIISDSTDSTESDSTETSTTDCEDCSGPADLPADSGGGSGGLVSRLVDLADRAATLLEPFATLISATVQAATVYTLIRKA